MLTWPTESPIRSLISFAALAERCASERTSDATTAKPRPCSPARAASTAAFSARMLVWNAMPSMTPMMSTILRDEASIEPIVSTTLPTMSPPLAATPEAASASWLAWWALSAFWRTVEVSSSIEAAVSSSELACCSVRADRSRLPAAISFDAVAIERVPVCDFRDDLEQRVVHRFQRAHQVADFVVRRGVEGGGQVAVGDRFGDVDGGLQRTGDAARDQVGEHRADQHDQHAEQRPAA